MTVTMGLLSGDDDDDGHVCRACGTSFDTEGDLKDHDCPAR